MLMYTISHQQLRGALKTQGFVFFLSRKRLVPSPRYFLLVWTTACAVWGHSQTLCHLHSYPASGKNDSQQQEYVLRGFKSNRIEVPILHVDILGFVPSGYHCFLLLCPVHPWHHWHIWSFCPSVKITTAGCCINGGVYVKTGWSLAKLQNANHI